VRRRGEGASNNEEENKQGKEVVVNGF